MKNDHVSVSILIPVYNTASYLDKCFESVLNQTLEDIEIIAVNDASPDNAKEILESYAAKDKRVRIITHKVNKGILGARLSGIGAARGDFLIFLDADDTLALDCAELSLAKARATGADMVHFCFDVRLGDGRKTPFAKDVEKALAPYNGSLLGKRVFEGAFVDGLYRWNICGKFIAREVCRKAAAALEDGYYVMAEDFCFYSHMAFFSVHYEPLFKKFYNYGLNIGVSSYTLSDFNGFKRSCSVFSALNAVKHFLERENVFQKYRKAFEYQELKILYDLMSRWEHKTASCDKKRSFEYMFCNYPASALCNAMCDYFYGFEETLESFLPRTFPVKTVNVKTEKIALYMEDPAEDAPKAAVFAEAASRKGAETLFVVPKDSGEWALPAGEILYINAPLEKCSGEEMRERGNFFFDLAAGKGIDTVIHMADSSKFVLWDALSIKSAGMRFVTVSRGGYVKALDDSRLGEYLVRLRALSFADGAVFDNPAERDFAALFKERSYFIKNNFAGAVRPAGKSMKILYAGSCGDLCAVSHAMTAFSIVKAENSASGLIFPLLPKAAAARHDIFELASNLGICDSLVFAEGCCLPELAGDCGCAVFAGDADIWGGRLEYIESLGLPVAGGSGFTPEETAKRIEDILDGEKFEYGSFAGGGKICKNDSVSELFDSLARKEPLPETAENIYRFFDSLGVCRKVTEPYVIEPPANGEDFIKFYRIMDSVASRIFKPGGKLRSFFFRGGRYLIKKFKKNS